MNGDPTSTESKKPEQSMGAQGVIFAVVGTASGGSRLALDGMTRLWTISLITLIVGCDKSPHRDKVTQSSEGTPQTEPSDKPSPSDEVARLKKEIQKQIEIGLTQYGIKC